MQPLTRFALGTTRNRLQDALILSELPLQILRFELADWTSTITQSSSPLTGSESVAFSTCSNASLLGSRYEVGRDVFSSVIRFFESPTLRSRSSDSRRSLLLAGSDAVAFSCSKASSLGSRSGIIAICTNSDGLHKIIHADWLKKSPHIFIRHIASAILLGMILAPKLRCHPAAF